MPPGLFAQRATEMMLPMYRINNNRLPNAPFPYGPSAMRHVYGFDQVTNFGGGQVIALIDAFDSPNAEADLGVFNQFWHLPACTTANGRFKKVYATGTPPPVDQGWGLEIALDVQWAHAIAPMAQILLVEAASNSSPDLFHAVDIAVQMGANVVSMSFSGPESPVELLQDLHFVTKGVTFVAASGDNGNFGGVGYPAASPFVVGVGGTTLVLDKNGNYGYETSWSGSGGGISAFEIEPVFQVAVQTTGGRGEPDVSYNADVSTGIAVYDSAMGGWFQVGGTSAGTPQWAGLFALANSLRKAAGKSPLGKPPFGLYSGAPNFHDIVNGTNGECGLLCDAFRGYDFVTGLGSPKADLLTQYLLSLP